ncbi:subtilisin-like protease [Andrographis paniculata]|uniref:subtilisin-like protease n=1 Tax=Andrographis paniculata TaxID=175694 RepID=UPI0021E9130A|nr:subtilisin-like protease [Andrographis paniculata]
MSSDEPSRMVRQYRNVITGFAAKLYPEEVKEMEKMEGFLHARPENVYSLHTTHTPAFLDLSPDRGAWLSSNYGKGVIIGVFDSGITPGHPSFDDTGVPPPPARWKGKCEFSGVACNNKLIGARNFLRGESGPPIDSDGHGTHTASTAAGNFVPGANTFHQANGTASGMAPLAHLAVYKVCDHRDCSEGDLLAAIETAIEDGVDVISASLGGKGEPFYQDSNVIGSFYAALNGVFVSASADNSGPAMFSVTNAAPWMLTVGSSTLDRSIVARVSLGNREELDGQSLNQVTNLPSVMLPLVYPGSQGDQAARFCHAGSLDSTAVKGKVVLCSRGGDVTRIGKGQNVKDAGGAAMIMMNDKVSAYSVEADPHVLPAAHVSYAAGEKIITYINSTAAPVATIRFKGTVFGDDTAPMVSSFSGRGPNSVSPGILKPDIIGPGSSILAAWPKSVDPYRHGRSTFNMFTGTSMSCPHLSGIAALIKSDHPDWSPAMIQSAIMTSASQTNLKGQPILDERNLPADVFAMGAGHVNPPKALDPGLVYDIARCDYISYLCHLYTEAQVRIIAGKKINCRKLKYRGISDEAQLNYPSFAVQLGRRSKRYLRTVINVGDPRSSYRAQIGKIPGVDVTVAPEVLRFEEVKEKKTYEVTFSRQNLDVNGSYVEGFISWVSPKHIVRMPISINLVIPG